MEEVILIKAIPTTSTTEDIKITIKNNTMEEVIPTEVIPTEETITAITTVVEIVMEAIIITNHRTIKITMVAPSSVQIHGNAAERVETKILLLNRYVRDVAIMYAMSTTLTIGAE